VIVVGKVKIILALALLALAICTGWQIGACGLANYELQDELKDVASLTATRIGWEPPSSDDNLREAVIRKAAQHDIRLEPQQIKVQRSGPPDAPKVEIAADYRVRVALPGGSLFLHFTPTSRSKGF
jgi:hypothetical protein